MITVTTMPCYNKCRAMMQNYKLKRSGIISPVDRAIADSIAEELHIEELLTKEGG